MMRTICDGLDKITVINTLRKAYAISNYTLEVEGDNLVIPSFEESIIQEAGKGESNDDVYDFISWAQEREAFSAGCMPEEDLYNNECSVAGINNISVLFDRMFEFFDSDFLNEDSIYEQIVKCISDKDAVDLGVRDMLNSSDFCAVFLMTLYYADNAAIMECVDIVCHNILAEKEKVFQSRNYIEAKSYVIAVDKLFRELDAVFADRK